MGFYLRRSLRFGPIRLNLSKSGLGISGGVRGARLGMNANGRAYVHAGRYGLYYRKNLPRAGTADGAGPGLPAANPAAPLEVQARTGATYPVAAAPDPAAAAPASALDDPPWVPPREGLWEGPGWIAVGGAAGLLLSMASTTPAIEGLGLLLLAACGGWALTRGLRRQRLWRATRGLEEQVSALLGDAATPDAAAIREIQQRIQAAAISAEQRAFERHRVHHALLKAAIADGRVDDAERRSLEDLAAALGLDAASVLESKQAAYHEVYLEALADHQLTREEERSLETLRERLRIPPAAIHEELAALEGFRQLRRIQRGELPIVDCAERLRRDEVCHYRSEARLLASRVLERHQREGRKTIVRGLVVKKQGTLLITDRRLLLIQRGAMSIPFRKLLDLEVDADRNLLILTKDGAVRPVFFTVPDAVRAGAILAAAAGL